MLTVLAAAALFAFYLWRDLNPPHRDSPESLPDVVVEDLTFDRVIEGKDWLVRAVRAEHRRGVIVASDLDMRVNEPSAGRSTRVTAREGEFMQENGNISLSSVEGTALADGRSIDWSAPVASYDSARDIWVFEEGVVASDDQTVVSGEIATIEPGNVFKIEKGANARWNVKE